MLDSLNSICLFKWLLMAFFILAIIFLLIRTIMRAICSPYPQIYKTENEKYFYDPIGDKKLKFPSKLENPSLDLSVIVPSYNEEERLPEMMNEALDFLENKRKNSQFTYEIIIVDDGSKDKTSKVGLEYSQQYTTERVRVLTLDKNRGKGGAIRMGVISSRGRHILFADADGASKFSDYSKLEAKLSERQTFPKDSTSEIIVCGSRRHLEKDSIAKRSLFRTILMLGFHSIVWLFCVKGIRDTQCGFKLFTRAAAIKCFANLHIERWAFDVDLLYIASYLGMNVYEVDINWQEKDGSKVTPASWIQMGKDILSIRLHYLFGAWKIDENLKLD